MCYKMPSSYVFFVWTPYYVLHEFTWFNIKHVVDEHEKKYKMGNRISLTKAKDTVEYIVQYH
jgi:hypothetical protein